MLSILACFSTQIVLASQATRNKVSLKNLTATSSSNLSQFNPRRAHFVLQVGGFNASQGKSQNIDIDGLIGDRFTVTNGDDQNILVGLGFFVDGFSNCHASTMFGLNAFYLAKTFVKGNIIQEQEFTNLDYRYSVSNYPIYFAAKTLTNIILLSILV